MELQVMCGFGWQGYIVFDASIASAPAWSRGRDWVYHRLVTFPAGTRPAHRALCFALMCRPSRALLEVHTARCRAGRAVPQSEAALWRHVHRTPAHAAGWRTRWTHLIMQKRW